MQELMQELREEGCDPSVYRRGKNLYRAHVNRFGNFWEDHKCPHTALSMAVEQWENAGKPMDGGAEVNV